MEERKPLVSVIVPVYNVYPYLRDCVQSVQAQSYQNWELLLVDDGSTDGSGELCDELAVEDDRIRVFHKLNGGQSDARNVGLKQAQGKYFYLLDSDDLIRSTAFDQFVERCEADGADAALTPLEMFSTEQPEGRTENPHQIPELLNREETMRRMLLHQGIGHGAGGVFFRREVWGDLQFPVGILYEDYAVMYRAIARCAKVEVFPEPMYDYRIHTGSTMKSGIAEKNLVILDVGEDVTRFIAETVPVLKAEAEYLQLVTYLKTLKGILDGDFANYPADPFADVTFSGGDPMYQPEGFTALAKAIKMRTKKNIWCYTGFKFEQLVKDPQRLQLLEQIDVVVDGPFVEALRDPDLPFRGSSNQRIIEVAKALAAPHYLEQL